MDRAVVRGYVDARLTGFLEWPVLDAMPPGLPYENRGLVTADQPWSGHYRVNALTWAIAQLTQVACAALAGQPGRLEVRRLGQRVPARRPRGRLLRDPGARHGGTALEHDHRGDHGQRAQRCRFRVTGGQPAGRPDRARVGQQLRPRTAAARRPVVRPAAGHPPDQRTAGSRLVIQPGWVYSLTTTTGQGKGTAAGPRPASFRAAATESLGSDARAGSADDEPAYLAAQDGAFELARCPRPRWRPAHLHQADHRAHAGFLAHAPAPGWRYPYATVGGAGLANYSVSVRHRCSPSRARRPG